MSWSAAAARDFVYDSGRVLEQRLFATLFDGADAGGVVAALAGYRNVDGGFGHGLEPDKRAPSSQPLDVEIAFERLVEAGAATPMVAELVTSSCDWLQAVCAPSAALPILLPTIAGFPRAAHFADNKYAPSINPTAAIAAHVHALGVAHDWVERATEFSLGEVEAGRVPGQAHDLLCLVKLINTAPDRDRVARLEPVIAEAIPTASFMKLDANDDSYGLTPLEFAPAPESISRSWFDETDLQQHLDALAAEQQPDGGWPISWQPPTEASRHEWRAIRTLKSMQTLTAYNHRG